MRSCMMSDSTPYYSSKTRNAVMERAMLCQVLLVAWCSRYRKASSRSAYGHGPFEVFLKSIDLIPQQQILQPLYGTIYIIDNVIVLSDLVESSGYSSKTLQKGSCPYAPLDEVLRYVMCCIVVYSVPGDVHRWYICVLLLQYREHWERVYHSCVFIFKLRCVSSPWVSYLYFPV